MSTKEIATAEIKPEDKTVKQLARELLDRLPDDVTWDEVQYRLCLGKIADQSNEAALRELSPEKTRKMIEQQDEEAYRKYVCDAIEEGLRELDAGQGIPQEEAEEIMKSWFE